LLTEGQTVADFTLADQFGTPVTWSSLRGRPVVVFFYPKADTPGCTREACAFRDLRAEFERVGATVLGVSADPVRRQLAFAEKHGLGLTLLSDPEHAILGPWGIVGDKKMYGKTVRGIVRTTILFDAEGRVAHVWSPVKVDGHVDAVLARVRSLVGGP
jgi:peroxiredoxin Q/BCP